MSRTCSTEMSNTMTTRRRRQSLTFAITAAGALALLPSCARVAVDPIEVKPIHITMDVNIRVQKQLDQFFAFEEDLLRGPGGSSTSTTSQPSGGASGG